MIFIFLKSVFLISTLLLLIIISDPNITVVIFGFSFSLSNYVKSIFSQENIHIPRLFETASECTLFLKKDDSFPLKNPGKIILIGSGARNTIKGGTGSGNVYTRTYTTIEEGLEKEGFDIISKDWLDKFPSFKKAKRQKFLKYIKKTAKKLKSDERYIASGAVEPEVEYNLKLEKYEKNNPIAAIFVLGRVSGEGSDRRAIKGDLYLTNSEIRDILYLNEKYEKFLLVLNVPGVVDISPITEKVKNIFLLSQLGSVTGDILAQVVLGKQNPSGKLTATWAEANKYYYNNEYDSEEIDNTRYNEGIYVGYRYFDSSNEEILFPFGHGLSYSNFSIEKISIINSKSEITINVKVQNIGKYPGKEVVQVYISPSQENKDKPYQTLVAFKKTRKIEIGQQETMSLNFKVEDCVRFDENASSYVLDKGKYIIRVGNSSKNTKVYGVINIDQDITIKTVKNVGVGNENELSEYSPLVKYKDNLQNIEEINLKISDFPNNITVNYTYIFEIYDSLKSEISEENITKICIGNFEKINPNLSNLYNYRVFGAAGETVSINYQNLILADGPAGIRLPNKFAFDENGIPFVPKKNGTEKRESKIIERYATALPIATALAQSFNLDLLFEYGKIIGEEMELFHVHLWLAPALNIQRYILCGRNFEYFSEDPLVSGKIAAAIIKGVQSIKNKGATIKHFLANNKEKNRLNNNSIMSERTLREIYLRAFEIAIKEGDPVALMTSYNLVNGKHASAREDLINDVLRIEWGFKGLIMSDWYNSNYNPIGIAKYPAQNAVENINSRSNLQMRGSELDYNLVLKAFKSGEIQKDKMYDCASKVIDTILKLNK